jgi:dTDP-4-amino-4,6-dideoxygalactose transaminase
MPVAEAAAMATLALPIYPELTEQQLQYVVDAVGKFYG